MRKLDSVWKYLVRKLIGQDAKNFQNYIIRRKLLVISFNLKKFQYLEIIYLFYGKMLLQNYLYLMFYKISDFDFWTYFRFIFFDSKTSAFAFNNVFYIYDFNSNYIPLSGSRFIQSLSTYSEHKSNQRKCQHPSLTKNISIDSKKD